MSPSSITVESGIVEVVGAGALTAVHQLSAAMGGKLVRMLLAGQRRGPGRTDPVIFPTHLVIWESA